MDVQQKFSYDEFPVYFNFNNFLATNETVISFTLTCVDTATGIDSTSSIIEGTPSLATPRVTVGVKGGVDQEEHKITVTVTTSFGQVYELELYLEITDYEIDGSFVMQPNDEVLFACDFVNHPVMVSNPVTSKTVTAIRASDGTTVTSTVILASGIDGQKVIIKIGDCTVNEIYRVETKVVTTNGNKHQMNVMVECKER